MKRSPELDAMAAADEAEISNRNVKRNQTVGMAALLLAGVFAAYLVLATGFVQMFAAPQTPRVAAGVLAVVSAVIAGTPPFLAPVRALPALLP